MTDEYKPHTLHHRDGRERRVQSVEEAVAARFDGFGEKPEVKAFAKAHDAATQAAHNASAKS